MSPRWLFLTAMGAIALLKTGVWFFPNTWLVVEIARNPFRDPFPPDYLGHDAMWTWLTPLVAHVLHATSVGAYVALNLSFALVFIVLVLWAMFRRMPERLARTGTIVFAMMPASWLGVYGVGPDGLTLLLLAIALVFASRWWLVLGAGVLLGLQHAEQAVVGAGAVILADVVARRLAQPASPIGWRFGAVLIAGVAAGRAALVTIFALSDVGNPGGRLDWMQQFADVLLVRAYLGWPWLLWSVLGAAWLVAAWQLREGRDSLTLFIPLGPLLLMTPLVFDQTRVLAVVTFPLLYRAWLSNREFLKSLGPRRTGWLAVAWVIVPVIFVLGARPFGSVLPYSIALANHLIFGSPQLPEDLGNWPFG